MIVVADASPLIFLGKLGRLELITTVFPGVVHVPFSIRDEVLAAPITPAEEQRLAVFLKGCKLEKVAKARRFASALSGADQEALTLALRRRADWLLCDDRLLREMAVVEGIRPMGTLGVLLRAMEGRMLGRHATRLCVEQLIQAHQMRISIEVYDAVMRRIEGVKG